MPSSTSSAAATTPSSRSHGAAKGSMRLVDADDRSSRSTRTWARRSRSPAARPPTRWSASPRSAARRHSSARSPTTSSAASSRTTSGRRRHLRDARRSKGGAPTARSLILVTPDGERTMNTFLGVSPELAAARSTPTQIAAAQDRLSRGLPVRPAGGQGRVPRRPRRMRAEGRPQGRADAVRRLLRRPPPRRVPAS